MKTAAIASTILIGPAIVCPTLPHIIGIAIMSGVVGILWIAYRAFLALLR